MARYLITYDNGHDETVTAADVDLDLNGDQYRFRDTNGRTVALAPRSNVLSIVLTEEPEAVTG
ncbi:hypothetical protein ACIF8T_21520 [Streptomyces sp. NPDC085946]|uniref:hypothetical protein n=1 Tax=Streptomyces sp. NPDC085946 TaxID=3365744 RepID=UPI0037D47337